MANTIIDFGFDLYIINTGSTSNQFRKKKVINIKLNRTGFLKYIEFYYKVKKILFSFPVDIIIASDLYSLPASCSLTGSKIIYDSREIYSQHAGMINNKIKQFFWYFIEKKYIDKTKAVLVTADDDKIFLKKLYKNIKIFSIYNFPSIKMKNKKNNFLRKKLGLLLNEIIFIYQGVLHPGRGIKNMILLLNYFYNAHAVIIGSGPYKNKILKLIKKKQK